MGGENCDKYRKMYDNKMKEAEMLSMQKNHSVNDILTIYNNLMICRFIADEIIIESGFRDLSVGINYNNRCEIIDNNVQSFFEKRFDACS